MITVRITFRNELILKGEDIREVKKLWDSMNVAPQPCRFVEVSSVETVDTFEDLKTQFEEA